MLMPTALSPVAPSASREAPGPVPTPSPSPPPPAYITPREGISRWAPPEDLLLPLGVSL